MWLIVDSAVSTYCHTLWFYQFCMTFTGIEISTEPWNKEGIRVKCALLR